MIISPFASSVFPSPSPLHLLIFIASVKFNFDVCDYKTYLKNSLNDFQFDGAMHAILDKYFDLSDNPILPASLTATIKEEIVSVADAKVKTIKQGIIGKINDIPCSVRRLEMHEVDGYGSQRILQSDLTFAALETAIKSISSDSVQSVSAGYFPSRNEIAIDVDIHVEQVFDKSDFDVALDTVFGYLDDAKAMFGADGVNANVTELLDNAMAVVEFDLSIR